MRKKICVIGAGPSGLTTIKQLLDEGHEPICFEKAKDAGGVFNYAVANKGTGRVYKNTLLTTSNYFTAFSDFPPNEPERIFWNHAQYLLYLRDYIQHFRLDHFIHFNTEIQSVEKKQNKWEVTIRCSTSGASEKDIFDGVAICSGTHQLPKTPSFKGQEDFEGKILHSTDYDDNQKFKNKKVVVIGIGESSADIVREISDVAETCCLLMRNYPFIIPRNQRGEAGDSSTSRAISAMIYPKGIFLKLYLFLTVLAQKIFSFLNFNKVDRDAFSQNVDSCFIDHNTIYSQAAIKLIKRYLLKALFVFNCIGSKDIFIPKL